MRGQRKKGREINGVLLLDKPKGLSSNAALQTTKLIYKARKAGHTGSLDPLATGLLPICFGEATKMSGFLLDADKEYQTVCKLGITTATGDAEGAVIQSKPVLRLSTGKIERVLKSFVGEIDQIPPMHSAVKYRGQRLYTLARQGQMVEREPRRIRIYEIVLLDYQKDEIKISIKCSKGTYIRTLVEDIGNVLGYGAHVAELCRTGAGVYKGQDMLSMDHIREVAKEGMDALDGLLQPLDSALENWPTITLNQTMSDYVKQGQAIQVPKAPTEGLLRLYEESSEGMAFIGVGHVLDDGRIAPKRLIQAEK